MLIGVIAEHPTLPITVIPIVEEASAQDQVDASAAWMVSEAANAVDVVDTMIVFAALVDDPASASEFVDAYLGVIMTEAASAADTTDVAVPPTGTTLNPADKGSHVALSNFNLTAGMTAAFNEGVRSTTAKSSGKFYFEVTWTVASTVAAAGPVLLRSTDPLNTGLGTGLSVGCSDGQIRFYGGNQGTPLGAIGTGTVCFAIDLVNARAWARLNGGNWNGSGTADPASNVGGINTSGLFPTSPAYAGILLGDTSGSATINFGAAAFAQTVPSGFLSWN